MNLFFSNLTPNTKTSELHDFILCGLRGWHPWTPAVEINRCDIVRITDLDSGRVDFHGLVTIRDQATAELAIKRLNGQSLNGAEIAVREYNHRIPGDRRITEQYLGRDERPEERRRKRLKLERRKDKEEEKKDLDLRDWFLRKGDR